jgi:hypothetical protein
LLLVFTILLLLVSGVHFILFIEHPWYGDIYFPHLAVYEQLGCKKCLPQWREKEGETCQAFWAYLDRSQKFTYTIVRLGIHSCYLDFPVLDQYYPTTFEMLVSLGSLRHCLTQIKDFQEQYSATLSATGAKRFILSTEPSR